MKKFLRIYIGSETYEVSLPARKLSVEEKELYSSNGADISPEYVFEAQDVDSAHTELAKQFLSLSSTEITPAQFNYLIERCGFRVSEIAVYLDIDKANISQWRKSQKISSAAWMACKLFFWDTISHKTVTLEPFLQNILEKNSRKEKFEIRMLG